MGGGGGGEAEHIASDASALGLGSRSGLCHAGKLSRDHQSREKKDISDLGNEMNRRMTGF